MTSRDLHLHVDTVRRLLRRHAKSHLENLLAKLHPADLALIFRHLTEEERSEIFLAIPTLEMAAGVLAELDDSIIQELIADLPVQKTLTLLKELSSDDEAYILRLLPDDQAAEILARLKASESKEMEQLMAYPENSAGALMTTEVFALHENITAKEAIASIQNNEDQEMVFYLYVVDDRQHLVGVISLRDLIMARPGHVLKDIMISRVHAVHPDMDQEEVAQVVSRYNFLAVPVVDHANKLLGIVTVDDVIDVIRDEATEDILQMAGAGSDGEIVSKNVMGNVKVRLPWLFVSWLGGLLAAFIISEFQITLTKVLALAAFLPIITGMAGNVGTQTATIIVRGLATGRIERASAWKIIFKELRVGTLLGLVYGLLLGIAAYVMGIMGYLELDAISPLHLGLTVCAGILSAMIAAGTIGALVPLFLDKLNLDPAIATGPFVTTSVDIFGVLLYFLIAGIFVL
ncbi:MAG TPA: magnesium transporter [Candidatus Marinimicrobia bacterium]|nr:MAG: magnesium transporter [Candidatus Marinimicrobia bacterium CG1_02_48_14]PJA51933.1 MAG: magnesium transporter [Candidatus Marinimicrobia bacterium CG_4_9_14_3_um_filter_48_9]HCW76300.1 magnesium transporter [Candidatus Neomarinimicrobiota bacterium]